MPKPKLKKKEKKIIRAVCQFPELHDAIMDKGCVNYSEILLVKGHRAVNPRFRSRASAAAGTPRWAVRPGHGSTRESSALERLRNRTSNAKSAIAASRASLNHSRTSQKLTKSKERENLCSQTAERDGSLSAGCMNPRLYIMGGQGSDRL